MASAFVRALGGALLAACAAWAEDAAVHFYYLGIDVQFLGAAPRPKISCDGRDLGTLKSGTYFVARLAPGLHKFKAGGGWLDLQLENRDYYVEL